MDHVAKVLFNMSSRTGETGPHQEHQTPHPVTTHTDAFTAQMTDHLAAAVEGALQEQLVDPAYQRQILRALALEPVVHRGSTHSKQPA